VILERCVPQIVLIGRNIGVGSQEIKLIIRVGSFAAHGWRHRHPQRCNEIGRQGEDDPRVPVLLT